MRIFMSMFFLFIVCNLQVMARSKGTITESNIVDPTIATGSNELVAVNPKEDCLTKEGEAGTNHWDAWGGQTKICVKLSE